jgi:predicted nucleic acid-binding protein
MIVLDASAMVELLTVADSHVAQVVGTFGTLNSPAHIDAEVGAESN